MSNTAPKPISEQTISLMRDRLLYDPETGVLTWRTHPNAYLIGQAAGTIGTGPRKGYIHVGVRSPGDTGRSIYAAHHIAWLLYYGVWPTVPIDHRDGNRTNNAIRNLREARGHSNQHNRKRCSLNTSGYHGVGWFQPQQKWRARIMVGSRQILLGYFDTPEAAYAARIEAERKYHGEFAASQRPS